MKKIILLLGAFYFAFAAYTTIEAKSHIGEYAEVCGKVYGIYHHKKGHIFINLDGKYPNQKMTFIIWSRYKDNFNYLNFNGKTICAKGVIKEYKGRTEMFIKTQKQIKIK